MEFINSNLVVFEILKKLSIKDIKNLTTIHIFAKHAKNIVFLDASTYEKILSVPQKVTHFYMVNYFILTSNLSLPHINHLINIKRYDLIEHKKAEYSVWLAYGAILSGNTEVFKSVEKLIAIRVNIQQNEINLKNDLKFKSIPFTSFLHSENSEIMDYIFNKYVKNISYIFDEITPRLYNKYAYIWVSKRVEIKKQTNCDIIKFSILCSRFNFARWLINKLGYKPPLDEFKNVRNNEVAKFIDEIYDPQAGNKLNIYYIDNFYIEFVGKKYKHLIPDHILENLKLINYMYN